ncbi:uncharacterized protein LOC114784335 [Denticeps clupeoides]|uniref:uncharacterized protein LOC114784335 n=1 Tax=Denticeps clupeoides TaxID=299321 RepID=UPI0010A43AF4|nr:uncharacterized protein LOC114784335 [Denticeps clupeoides]
MSSAGTNPGKSSTEDCPHCGRTFKRLKTHLPHCRMAPGPPVQQELRDGAFTAEGKKGPSKAKTKQRNLKSEGTLSRKQDVKDPASEGLSRHVDKPKKQRPVRTVAGSDQLQQHLPGGPAPLRSTGKKAPVKKTQAPQEAPRVSSQTQGERSQDAHAKTSVWDHIHVGLLSRKFQGDFTRSPAGSVWTPGLRNETSRFHQIPEDRTQKISPQIVQNVTHHGTELLERRPPYEGKSQQSSPGPW